MLSFDLANGFSIKAIDSKNFAVVRTFKIEDKKSENFGEEREEILGYYPSLSMAYHRGLDKVVLSADSVKELKAIVEDLKKIKQVGV